MPITTGAKKAVRRSERKRIFNLRRIRAMKAAVKQVRDALTRGEVGKAKESLPTAYQAIDKAEKRGVIKSNTANRKKSRLVAAVKRSDS